MWLASMSTKSTSVPETCSLCPHLETFHSTCSHPLRQSIIRELSENRDGCPLFAEIRSDAMRDLEGRLE